MISQKLQLTSASVGQLQLARLKHEHSRCTFSSYGSQRLLLVARTAKLVSLSPLAKIIPLIPNSVCVMLENKFQKAECNRVARKVSSGLAAFKLASQLSKLATISSQKHERPSVPTYIIKVLPSPRRINVFEFLLHCNVNGAPRHLEVGHRVFEAPSAKLVLSVSHLHSSQCNPGDPCGESAAPAQYCMHARFAHWPGLPDSVTYSSETATKNSRQKTRMY